MVLLDASFIIDIMHGIPKSINLFKELEDKKTELFVSSITIMEIWIGALQSKRASEKEKMKVEDFIANTSVIPFNVQEAKEAAEIETELLKKGITIESEDIMNAGIALIHNETIVTNDIHYTYIEWLKVLKY